MPLLLPDWAEKINAYLWLAFISSVLVGISIIYNDKYISLWLMTFVYGLLGFASNAYIKNHFPRVEKVLTPVLFLLYITVFTGLAVLLTETRHYFDTLNHH